MTEWCSLVSCSYDLFVKLWNVDNDYQNFATLRGHEHSVSSARFLPGDDRVVSASRDQTVRIWSIASTYA
jgi:platelet-activating factor acetylhydrolase IB subunit alpha